MLGLFVCLFVCLFVLVVTRHGVAINNKNVYIKMLLRPPK